MHEKCILKYFERKRVIKFLKNTLLKNVSQSVPAGHAARLKLLTMGHNCISILYTLAGQNGTSAPNATVDL